MSLLLALLLASSDGGARVLHAEAFGGLYRADYATVGGDTRGFAGAQISAGLPLPDPLRLRLDLLGGRFGPGEHLGSGALRAYGFFGRFVGGASWGHTELQGGIRSDTFALHGEVDEEDWLRVALNAGVEVKGFGDDLRFAELFLRFYPGERWLASAGVSYAVSELKQTRADTVLRGEWTALRTDSLSVALYGQFGSNLYTKLGGGLIVYFDGLPYAERERRDALWAARFK